MFWKKKKNKEEIYGWSVEQDIRLIDYLVDGLLVFDKNSRLSLANSQAERFFEIDRKEILGKTILELGRFDRIKPLASLLIGGAKEFFRQELPISENFILELTTVPIMERGEKSGSLVVLHDISREKTVDKMKSEFVAFSAHRLRTPASAIKWTLGMFLEGEFGKLTQEQQEVMEKTYQANERLIKTVNDFLNVAQIEEGRYLSKTTLSDIGDLIGTLLDGYKEEIKQRKIKLEFKRSGESLPRVMLDQEKMKIAVRNIFENALKYTLAGGKVSVSLKKRGKEIEVEIRDSGVGIPANQQDKVFTKFFRGSNVMRMETEGVGLGLYIAKNIIEAHNGRIWFDSEEGKGTAFYFIIPIKEKFAEFLTEKFY